MFCHTEHSFFFFERICFDIDFGSDVNCPWVPGGGSACTSVTTCDGYWVGSHCYKCSNLPTTGVTIFFRQWKKDIFCIYSDFQHKYLCEYLFDCNGWTVCIF